MAIEIEKKYRLNENQFEQIQQTLEDLSADFHGEDFEENTIYGGGNLQEINAILRIRKIGLKTILTFKKRTSNDSGIKEQIEHETTVGDAAELEKMFGFLGYKKQLIYEKHRKTWRFKKVEIVLDKLPFGLFMEIEGTVLTIKEAEMLIGAENFETEYKTYPFLTAELGKAIEDHIEARF